MRHVFMIVLGSISLVLFGCAESEPRLGTTVTEPVYVAVDRAAVELLPSQNALRVNSNSADVTYTTHWTIGENACVRVVPRIGEPVILRGSPMVVDYHHVGRMVGVAIGPDGQQNLYGFVEPISWQTEPCPP